MKIKGDLQVTGVIDNIGPGFYGIIVRESDGNPPPFRNDTLTFDSEYFYISKGGNKKPLVSIRLAGINAAGTIPLSALNDELQDITAGLVRGMELYHIGATVTSNGSTVTFTAFSESDEEMQLVVRDVTGEANDIVKIGYTRSATLTPGSDIAPTVNYVYILHSAPTVIVVSTVDFPDNETAPHTKLGRVLCQSAASVQSYGPYSVFGYSDSISYHNGTGHLSHINEWIREQPATWHSGIVFTPTINTAPAPDTVTFESTSGSVYRVHESTFPAFASPAPIYVVNHPTTAYSRVTTMPGLTSGGTAIGNGNRISVVIWGNVSNSAGDCKLFMNLPSGYYGSDAAAIADGSKYTNFTIPTAYKGSGFLISKCTFSYATGGGGQYTLVEHLDLRGLFPSLAAGGSTAAGTTFPDNVFRIEDNLDATKEIAFQASGITTGTTRTLTVQDADGTIAYVNQIGPGFYGISVVRSDNLKGYNGINVLAFEAANFYISRSTTDRDRARINLRPSSGGSGTITGGTALGGTEPVFAGTVVPNLTFKGLTSGTGISLSSNASAITITNTGPTLAQIGPGFYGITVGQSNNLPSYKNINTIKFLATDFYVNQNSTNPDEVIINLRPTAPVETDTISFQIEAPKITNYFLDSGAFRGFNVNTVRVLTEEGACGVGFYIRNPALSGGNRKQGVEIAGLDATVVGKAKQQLSATGANTVVENSELIMSVFYIHSGPKSLRGNLKITYV